MLAMKVLDVLDADAQHKAFEAHVARLSRGSGPVTIVLNAGISERGDLFDPLTLREASVGGWQSTLDVDLTAVITGMR